MANGKRTFCKYPIKTSRKCLKKIISSCERKKYNKLEKKEREKTKRKNAGRKKEKTKDMSTKSTVRPQPQVVVVKESPSSLRLRQQEAVRREDNSAFWCVFVTAVVFFVLILLAWLVPWGGGWWYDCDGRDGDRDCCWEVRRLRRENQGLRDAIREIAKLCGEEELARQKIDAVEDDVRSMRREDEGDRRDRGEREPRSLHDASNAREKAKKY